MLDTLTRKAGFISQVMRNEVATREVDDLSQVVLGYEELRLLATGDPAVQRRLTLQNRVDQLAFAKSSFEGQRRDLRRKAETVHVPAIGTLAPMVNGMQLDAQAIHEAAEASRRDGWPGMVVGGTPIHDRKAASEALNRATLALPPGSEEKVGTYLGLDVMAKAEARPIDLSGGTAIIRSLGVRGQSGTCYWNPNPIGTGAATQLDNVLRDGFDKAMSRAESELDQHRRAVDAIREATSKPWEGEAELAEARAELDALPPDTEPTRRHARKVTREDVRAAAMGASPKVAAIAETIAGPQRLSDTLREAVVTRATTPVRPACQPSGRISQPIERG